MIYCLGWVRLSCPKAFAIVIMGIWLGFHPALASSPRHWQLSGKYNPEPTPSVQLHLISWKAKILGQTQPGTACWIAGPNGSFRLEILPGGQSGALMPLLHQDGDGFTLILGSAEAGTFNPWLREWRKVDSSAANWVRMVAGVLSGDDPHLLAGSLELRLIYSDGIAPIGRIGLACEVFHNPHEKRIQVQLPALAGLSTSDPPAEASNSPARSFFRQRMAHRGRGRGGQEEILTLVTTNSSGRSEYNLSSSRKPGRIQFFGSQAFKIAPPGVEVFAPLWPLAELLDFLEKN